MSTASFLQQPVESGGEISGLTQAEAEARFQAGQDNSIAFKQGRSRKDIVREAIFSTYTFDLLGIAVVYWLLEQPVSALFSLTILVLLFGWNVSRAFKAKDKLDQLMELTRPEASVIRNSRLRAIDPNEIVPGDAVVVGPGDQFYADGRLLSDDPISINDSWLTGSLQARSLGTGDSVLAGSYCLSGHGIYQAEVVGDERQVTAILENAGAAEHPPTPLQRIIGRVLAGLRILVVVFGVYVVFRYVFIETDPELRTVYENSLSIILGLAPGGIFFMILLTYITGSSKLASAGAIVPRAETVESLAQTDVLCLGKGGTLTGTLVDFEPIEEAGEDVQFSQSHVQQILGDFARSTRSRSKLIQAMELSFDGTKRKPKEDALFLSIAGWQGIVFDDDDLEGSYILGLEEAISSHLDWRHIERDSLAITGPDLPSAKKFLFTYSPDLKRLRDSSGLPRLPERLMPLGYLLFSEEMRPEVQATSEAFIEAGIALRVLSSQDEEKVLALVDEADVTRLNNSPPDVMSGPELASVTPEAYANAVAQTEIFGRLTPDQKGDIVKSLREQGALVTMVGDSVTDLNAQISANLSVTFRESSQAALSIADVILLDDSLNALPSILKLGQAIYGRLLDVIRLTLTHATTAVLLTLFALFAGADYFPYLPAHNSAITIITITIPAIGFSFWLTPGQVSTNGLGRRLAFFILPAGISMAILALMGFLLFRNMTGNIYYARVAITHLLVGAGLLLILFVQPPSEFWVGGDTLSNDKRPAILAVVLWFVFYILSVAPIAQKYLSLQPLSKGEHYLIILALLSVWVLALRYIWRTQWFRQLSGIAAIDAEVPAWLQ
jgi:cation-transporting ATPase E